MAKRFTPRSSPFAPCLLRQSTAVSSGNGFKANSPVKQVEKRGIRTVVLGFVQQAGTSANDQSLSTQRARNVACTSWFATTPAANRGELTAALVVVNARPKESGPWPGAPTAGRRTGGIPGAWEGGSQSERTASR